MKNVPAHEVHDCALCPLKQFSVFLPHSKQELETVQSQKRKESLYGPGEEVIREGQIQVPLFTVLQGWAFRFKSTATGQRQILSFLLPGDLVGVQQNMAESAAHGVEALTDLRVCVFERDAMWQLHQQHPALGFKITSLTAKGEWLVDDALLSVGKRSAEERVARLLVLLFKRLRVLQPDFDMREGMVFPLTQQHIADALGLSLVHTHRTLRRLEKKGLHQVRDGRLHVCDPVALAELADLNDSTSQAQRPLV